MALVMTSLLSIVQYRLPKGGTEARDFSGPALQVHREPGSNRELVTAVREQPCPSPNQECGGARKQQRHAAWLGNRFAARHAEPYRAPAIRAVAVVAAVGGGQVVNRQVTVATTQTARRTVDERLVPLPNIAAHVIRSIRAGRCRKRPNRCKVVHWVGVAAAVKVGIVRAGRGERIARCGVALRGVKPVAGIRIAAFIVGRFIVRTLDSPTFSGLGSRELLGFYFSFHNWF